MEQMEVRTEFAPAEFASVEEIQRQRLLFQDTTLMTQMVDAVPDILLVLNR